MILDFRIIPHRSQRYPTVGDYFHKNGAVHFRVSRMKDKRYPVLVLLHEMIEFFVCRLQGVKLRDIDRFDIAYEKARAACEKIAGDTFGAAPCGCPFRDEPGDDPCAPYHGAHVTATACEKLIADALGVRWAEYDEAVEAL